MRVAQIKTNGRNPRQIRGEKLELLKKSIANFEKMMSLRPIIIDETNKVLGGNMRLAAIKSLGMKEIPDEWVKRADDLTEDEKAQFIITDNASFGEWDWDLIANEWTDLPLDEWGLDVPGFEPMPDLDGLFIDDINPPEEKHSIVLHYSADEIELIKIELLKHGKTYEAAVWALCGL
jgi:hypothetical protein